MDSVNKSQAFNPYLPSYEYIPDAEPRVFGDRVYIYGSHDKFNGISFCLLDYVCYSAPVSDLSDWRYEGVIFSKKQDPACKKGILNMLAAPDVIRGTDGRYYLYYFFGYNSRIAVAVCDTPAGKYEFLGEVKYADGVRIGKKGEPIQFDPGIFIDDDGRVFLYTGFGPVKFSKFLLRKHKATKKGAMCFELEPDMLTIKGDMKYIGVPAETLAKGTEYEGHGFFEAASMRKIGDKYYFVYSSNLNHELCYAVSDSPDKDFKYGGILVSIGDIGLSDKPRNYLGNTHGGLLQLNNKHYIFYHRHTNRHWFSRQACAEEIKFENGKFFQAEITSCGLNGAPLKGEGEYEARIACRLYSKNGVHNGGVLKKRKGCHPYFTQTGKDRNDNPDQHIANFCDGATAVFKYFAFNNSKRIEVKVKGRAKGVLQVSYAENGEIGASVNITPAKNIATFTADLAPIQQTSPLYFKYVGKGKLDFVSFKLVAPPITAD